MIFEQSKLAFSVLDVVSLDQKSIRLENSARRFSALSYRYPDSVATIEACGEVYDVGGAITYVPANISYTRTAKQDRLIAIHFTCHTYYASRLELFYPQNTDAYATLFERAYAVWHSDDPAREHTVSAIMYEIFANAFREHMPKAKPDTLLARAVSYIEANCYRTDFSVESVAGALYVSGAYLRRLFCAAYGQSPKEYVMRRRIERAMSLLEMQYYSVAEVALRCGFRDARYFSTAFRKALGCTPSEYRYDFPM